jgi:hypothetical protein
MPYAGRLSRPNVFEFAEIPFARREGVSRRVDGVGA